MLNKIAVLWSPHQDSFHKCTVETMLKDNAKIFNRGRKGDFIVLAFTETMEEASDILDKLRAIRNERDKAGE